jgi:hypothetical protein
MRRVTGWLVLVVFSVLVAITACEEEKTKMVYELKEPDNLPTEVYQVYSALIDYQFSHHKYVVVQQETDTTIYPQTCREIMQSDTTSLDQTTLDNYQYGNNFSRNLDLNKLTTETHVKLITREEFDSYETWDRFHENYSEADGLIRFSLPGFNGDTTRAVFDYSWQTDDADVQNYVVYLEYRQGAWMLDAHEPV